jgi:calcineurin-like phosphoesterase
MRNLLFAVNVNVKVSNTLGQIQMNKTVDIPVIQMISRETAVKYLNNKNKYNIILFACNKTTKKYNNKTIFTDLYTCLPSLSKQFINSVI